MSYILVGDSRSVAIAVSEGCTYHKFVNARGHDGNRYYAKESMGASWLKANINQIVDASKGMDCIVIKMGGNDCTNPKAVQNYIAAAEELQRRTGKPIVFSSTDPQTDQSKSSERKKFNQRIAAECQKRGWGYINTYDYVQKEINAHPNYVRPDGVHYNPPLNGMISKYMKQHFPDVSNQMKHQANENQKQTQVTKTESTINVERIYNGSGKVFSEYDNISGMYTVYRSNGQVLYTMSENKGQYFRGDETIDFIMDENNNLVRSSNNAILSEVDINGNMVFYDSDGRIEYAIDKDYNEVENYVKPEEVNLNSYEETKVEKESEVEAEEAGAVDNNQEKPEAEDVKAEEQGVKTEDVKVEEFVIRVNEDIVRQEAQALVDNEMEADFAVGKAEDAKRQAEEIKKQAEDDLKSARKNKAENIAELEDKAEQARQNAEKKKNDLNAAKQARKEADAQKIADEAYKQAKNIRKAAEKDLKDTRKSGDAEKIAAAEKKLHEAQQQEADAEFKQQEVRRIRKENKEKAEELKKQEVEKAKAEEKKLKEDTKAKEKELDEAEKELKAAEKERDKAQNDLDKAKDEEKQEKQLALDEANKRVEARRQKVDEAQRAYDEAKRAEDNAKKGLDIKKKTPQEQMLADKKKQEELAKQQEEEARRQEEIRRREEEQKQEEKKNENPEEKGAELKRNEVGDDKDKTVLDESVRTSQNMEWCINAVPTNLQNKLKAMGVLDQNEGWMNSRQLREKLKNIKMSDEQKAELVNYADNRAGRKKAFLHYKRTRKILDDYSGR